MKKIILILLVLMITACGNEEVTVKNPDGKSLTYQYFSDLNLNNYTLKIKENKNVITIKKVKENIYYKTSNLIIIEKNGIRYTLDVVNKTYSATTITKSLNYTEGILPVNIDKLKNKSYKTGKEKINSFKYTYETYKNGKIKTTYYFENQKLKFIRKKTDTEDFLYEVLDFKEKVNDKTFEIPKDYTGMVY